MPIKKEHRGIVKWAFLTSLGTLISRIFGLLREMAMAALFGTGAVADAFSAAFRFPNLLRRAFGESGLLVVLVPRYTQERVQLGDDEAFVFASSVAVALAFAMAVVIALGVITAPYVAYVFAYGWHDEPEKFALTVRLLRLLFPYIGFMAFSTWAMAVLNAHKRFFLPGLAPAFLNLGWLAGALFVMWRCRGIAPEKQALIVAGGVLLGGAMQFAVQLPAMAKIGFRFKPLLRRKISAIVEVGRLLAPAFAGLAVAEVNFIVDILLASFLPEGSVAALTYSNRMIFFPMGLASIAMATASLPALSDLVAQNETERFRETLSFSTRLIWGAMLPISAYILALRRQIVAFLLERGSFSGAVSTPMTAYALGMYAFGLFAFSSFKILTQGFYAMKDTKTPVITAALALGINIVLNLLLVGPLAHGGLALASSLASTIQVFILLRILHKRGALDFSDELRALARIAAASFVIFALTWAFAKATELAIPQEGFAAKTAQLFIPSLLWALATVAVGRLGKVAEIDQFLQLLLLKLRRR